MEPKRIKLEPLGEEIADTPNKSDRQKLIRMLELSSDDTATAMLQALELLRATDVLEATLLHMVVLPRPGESNVPIFRSMVQPRMNTSTLVSDHNVSGETLNFHVVPPTGSGDSWIMKEEDLLASPADEPAVSRPKEEGVSATGPTNVLASSWLRVSTKPEVPTPSALFTAQEQTLLQLPLESHARISSSGEVKVEIPQVLSHPLTYAATSSDDQALMGPGAMVPVGLERRPTQEITTPAMYKEEPASVHDDVEDQPPPALRPVLLPISQQLSSASGPSIQQGDEEMVIDGQSNDREVTITARPSKSSRVKRNRWRREKVASYRARRDGIPSLGSCPQELPSSSSSEGGPMQPAKSTSPKQDLSSPSKRVLAVSPPLSFIRINVRCEECRSFKCEHTRSSPST